MKEGMKELLLLINYFLGLQCHVLWSERIIWRRCIRFHQPSCIV